MVGRLIGRWVVLLAAGLTLWSCGTATAPQSGVWVADPESVAVDHRLCHLRIEPRRADAPFFTSFLLTLVNKSGSDLEIDWNESRYLFNGGDQGLLVFEGIDPAAVKAAAIPPETIAPGARFSRDLMPLRLIAWTPLAEKTARHHGISPGMLPAGENGIRLTLRHESGRVSIPLSVRIRQQDAP